MKFNDNIILTPQAWTTHVWSVVTKILCKLHCDYFWSDCTKGRSNNCSSDEGDHEVRFILTSRRNGTQVSAWATVHGQPGDCAWTTDWAWNIGCHCQWYKHWKRHVTFTYRVTRCLEFPDHRHKNKYCAPGMIARCYEHTSWCHVMTSGRVQRHNVMSWHRVAYVESFFVVGCHDKLCLAAICAADCFYCMLVSVPIV